MKTRSGWIGVLVLAGVTAGAIFVQAEEPTLQGAEALIGKIQAELAASSAATPPAEDPAIAAYKAERESFLQTAPSLPAAQAAEAWLVLAGKFWKLPTPSLEPNRYSYCSPYAAADSLSFAGLIAAIPAPEAWPLIQEKLALDVPDSPPEDQARTAILRAAFAFLNRDPVQLKGALDFLAQQKASLESYQRDQFREQIRELEAWISNLEGQGEGLAARFEKDLKNQKSGSRSYNNLEMPDLVSLAGPEKAEILIRKAFAVAGLRLEISGETTLRLAQQLALAQLDTLPSPQWALVDSSSNGLALFEGMCRKFARPQEEEDAAKAAETAIDEPLTVDQPVQGWNDYGYTRDFGSASVTYLFGLLLQNRTTDALKQALTLKEEDVSQYTFTSALEKHDQVSAPVLLSFLGQWLAAKPEFPLWDAYVQLAAVAGRTDEAVQMLDQTTSRTDLSLLQRFEVTRGKCQMFLALDRTEEAAALWRTLADLSATNEMPPVQIQLETRKLMLAQTWAQAGLALKRTDWFDAGIALDERVRTRLAELKPDENQPQYNGCSDVFMDGLLELNRFAEAEQRVWSELTSLLAETKKRSASMGEMPPMDLSSTLEKLVAVYSKAGRHADVLALFEKAPWWGSATNLADLSPKPFFVPAAQALHAAGRDGEAWAILTRYLATESGDDKAYAMLVQIPNADLMPFLDRLYVRDRFEERPLIWKATLLLKDGKLDEAETLVRQALKVDPTDGEQPKGDRVRAYAVLADILTAKNKPDDAEFFTKVVKSVRIAEEGDQMNEAGLTVRSLKLYAEAETYFADAYCVQWRLAERLQALGQTDEAQKHYQIAFERMPEQFGQVASLCFGCMGIFDNSESRSVAETVLTRLATNIPVRPPVFYLLGQLREEQKRYSEAYAEYSKAVALDPDYLDVWEKINGLRDRIDLPSAEWSVNQLRMMRMDPLGRHIHIRPETLMDLKGFWAAQLEALKLNMPYTDNLLPLTASLEAEAKRQTSAMNPFGGRMNYRYSERPERVLPPGDIIAKLPFLNKLDEVQTTLGLSQKSSAGIGHFGRNYFVE